MGEDLLGMELPTTVEEYRRRIQLARREGFVDGTVWSDEWSSSNKDSVQTAARHRYPIRTVVPRVVTVPRLAGGVREVKVVDGVFWVRQPGDREWVRQHAVITDGTVRALYDLLENPYTYEEE